MKRLIICLCMFLSPAIASSEPDASVKGEIEHLIARLGSSGCQFFRNGSWYTSERAVSHLNRKYAYLLKRDWVPTTEAFIERAAAESSVSGKPYLVKCAGAAAVPSATWLREELAKFRTKQNSAPANASPSGARANRDLVRGVLGPVQPAVEARRGADRIDPRRGGLSHAT